MRHDSVVPRFIVFAAILALGPRSVSAFDIAKDGRAAAVVVVGENPAATTVTAANELANYLSQITGAKFTIAAKPEEGRNAILVGTPYPDGKPEEFCIRLKDAKTLELTGEGMRGTIYAVYAFLERFGVRFWAPDSETVPRTKDLSVPQDLSVVSAPAFEFRQPYGEADYNSKWCVKNRVNHGAGAPIPGDWGGEYSVDFGESLGLRWLTSAKYFDAHPDWYAWRDKEKKHIAKGHICTLNEEGMRHVIAEIREHLQKAPDTRFVSVSMNDSDLICQCDKCRELTEAEGPSALFVSAANEVAKALAKDYPKLRIVMLAFWVAERPPKTLRLEPNVSVCFAMLDRNHAGPPGSIPRYAPHISRWCELARDHVYIWTYNAQFKNFLLPTPTFWNLGPELRDYKERHVRGVFVQLPWGTLGDFVDLRCWLLAQLAWKPDQDENALIAEWINGTCGEGAPDVLAYLALLKKAVSGKVWVGAYDRGVIGWMKPEYILEARGLFQRASAATAGNPRANAWVRKLSASVLMATIVEYNKLSTYAAETKVALPPYDTLVDELEALGKEFKCSCWREWEDFGGLIKKIRRPKTVPLPKLGEKEPTEPLPVSRYCSNRSST